MRRSPGIRHALYQSFESNERVCCAHVTEHHHLSRLMPCVGLQVSETMRWIAVAQAGDGHLYADSQRIPVQTIVNQLCVMRCEVGASHQFLKSTIELKVRYCLLKFLCIAGELDNVTRRGSEDRGWISWARFSNRK